MAKTWKYSLFATFFSGKFCCLYTSSYPAAETEELAFLKMPQQGLDSLPALTLEAGADSQNLFICSFCCYCPLLLSAAVYTVTSIHIEVDPSVPSCLPGNQAPLTVIRHEHVNLQNGTPSHMFTVSNPGLLPMNITMPTCPSCVCFIIPLTLA